MFLSYLDIKFGQVFVCIKSMGHVIFCSNLTVACIFLRKPCRHVFLCTNHNNYFNEMKLIIEHILYFTQNKLFYKEIKVNIEINVNKTELIEKHFNF